MLGQLEKKTVVEHVKGTPSISEGLNKTSPLCK